MPLICVSIIKTEHVRRQLNSAFEEVEVSDLTVYFL